MSIEAEFWHDRWRTDNTPWHRDAPSPRLTAHVERLDLGPGQQVLVPLCGRAGDMHWLRERGQRVLGVELSDIAARGFFDQHGMAVSERRAGAFRAFDGDGVSILCGDVLALEASHLSQVAAVYDRAALVALDLDDRQRYAALLSRLLPAGVGQLILSLEYDTASMQGPPFSVPVAAVSGLYAPRWQTRRVASQEILDEEPRLRERGLSALTEHVLLLSDS